MNLMPSIKKYAQRNRLLIVIKNSVNSKNICLGILAVKTD